MRLSRLFLVAALVAIGWSSPARAELRLALVIGNNDYAEAPLTASISNARAMAKALRGLGFEVIERENLTKALMEDEIDRFTGRLGPGAVSVFYFSGHGLHVKDRNYLLGTDTLVTGPGSAAVTAVDVTGFTDALAAAKGQVDLVILDACHDHPALRLNGIGAGLAAVTPQPASMIAYAAAPGRILAPGSSQSVYATELVKALKIPALPVTEAFAQAATAVSNATGGSQAPWSASGLTGKFYFIEPVTAAQSAAEVAPRRPPRPVPVDPETIERALWLSAKDSKDPAAFQSYLTRYPDGRYATLAKNSLRLLQQKSAMLTPLTTPPPLVFQPPVAAQQLHIAAAPTERQQYDHALHLMRDANYPDAEQEFRDFVSKNPSSPLAGLAQYWLGETYYVRGQFTQAADIFHDGVQTYPKSPRAAESLLKLGLSQLALGQTKNACESFAQVLSQYHDAPDAILSKATYQQKEQHCLTPPRKGEQTGGEQTGGEQTGG